MADKEGKSSSSQGQGGAFDLEMALVTHEYAKIVDFCVAEELKVRCQ